MTEPLSLSPIGIVRSPWTAQAGTPIQPAFAEGAEGTVEVRPDLAAGLADLDGFSRIWLLYWLHRADGFALTVTPYLDDTPHGLFATRAPRRPCPIGLSCVRLLGVDGAVLRIADVDLLDGTPLLDIKPYVPRFDAWPDERAGWLPTSPEKRGRADDRFA